MRLPSQKRCDIFTDRQHRCSIALFKAYTCNVTEALYLNKQFSQLFLFWGGGGGGGERVGKPDIDVSRHLQKTDMELWDGHEYSYSELNCSMWLINLHSRQNGGDDYVNRRTHVRYF